VNHSQIDVVVNVIIAKALQRPLPFPPIRMQTLGLFCQKYTTNVVAAGASYSLTFLDILPYALKW